MVPRPLLRLLLAVLLLPALARCAAGCLDLTPVPFDAGACDPEAGSCDADADAGADAPLG